MPAGRPTIYTPEIAELVCEVIESEPGSIRIALMGRDDLPGFSTVHRWEQQHPEFRDRLSRARELRAHLLADDALAVADESEHDTITKRGRNGEEFEAPDSEWMARSRLRFEARRWHAKNLNQRAYGDQSSVNLGGQPENPLKTESTTLAVDPASLPAEDRDALMRIIHRTLQAPK